MQIENQVFTYLELSIHEMSSHIDQTLTDRNDRSTLVLATVVMSSCSRENGNSNAMWLEDRDVSRAGECTVPPTGDNGVYQPHRTPQKFGGRERQYRRAHRWEYHGANWDNRGSVCLEWGHESPLPGKPRATTNRATRTCISFKASPAVSQRNWIIWSIIFQGQLTIANIGSAPLQTLVYCWTLKSAWCLKTISFWLDLHL